MRQERKVRRVPNTRTNHRQELLKVRARITEQEAQKPQTLRVRQFMPLHVGERVEVGSRFYIVRERKNGTAFLEPEQEG